MTNEEVVAILASQAEAHDGRLEPEMLATEARDPTHPLHPHPYFDWDNESAAHKYNTQAAARIIKSVKFVFETKDKQVITSPIYVRDPTRVKSNYTPRLVIRNDRDASREALLAACERVVNQMRFAITLAKVLEMDTEIEQMKDQMTNLMGRIVNLEDTQPAGSAD